MKKDIRPKLFEIILEIAKIQNIACTAQHDLNCLSEEATEEEDIILDQIEIFLNGVYSDGNSAIEELRELAIGCDEE